jgi:hypothetical protein
VKYIYFIYIYIYIYIHTHNICVYTYNGLLFSHKEEQNHVVCRKTDGTGDHHVKWNKSDWERQISHILSHTWNLDGINELHECKMVGTVWGWEPAGGGKWKGGEYDQSTSYVYMEIK